MNVRLTASGGSSQRPGFGTAVWAAAGSGLVQALAFPPVGASWVVLLALVPLLWAAYDPAAGLGFRRRFVLGFLSQVVFNVILLHWILFLSNEEVTIPGIMIPSLLFMAAYLGVFFGLAVAVSGWIQDRGGPAGPLTLPVFWTLADFARGVGVLGFPWGSLGYSLATQPAALQTSAWSGYWALPFWILLVNGIWTLALRAWLRRDQRAALRRAAWGLALAAAPVLFGAWILKEAPPPIPVADVEKGEAAPWAAPADGSAAQDASSLRVALVQANTPREIKWEEEYRAVVVEDLLDRTRRAAEFDPELIVWPETAAPVMIFWEPDLAAEVRSTVAGLRRWVLIGTLDAVLRPDRGYDEYNAAALLSPDGFPVQRYYKMHLVPFSEAMPFREKAPWMNALDFGQSEFSTGKSMTVFRAEEDAFSVLICFESIFPGLARRAVRNGARYLVNITNDFWFGRSAGPVQHAHMAVHRAVETRTPLIRCANSGISFLVDPYGRVYGETGLFEEALLLAEVPSGRDGSFHTRHGEWFMPGLAGLALLCLVSGLAGRGGRRS